MDGLLMRTYILPIDRDEIDTVEWTMQQQAHSLEITFV